MKDTIHYKIMPSDRISGEIDVPGDKSISHRCVIFSSIASGTSHISGLLEGEDVLATIAAFSKMGIQFDGPNNGELSIRGNGLHGLKRPKSVLDMGNSGTAMRLLTGLLSAQNFDSVLTGDESLSRRPMMRVIKPLSKMGGRIKASNEGTSPLHISACLKINGGHFVLPVASAQIKSAIVLAGLYANDSITIIEPAISRDHTERMLNNLGCEVDSTAFIEDASCSNHIKAHGTRRAIVLQPVEKLSSFSANVPGDISSAAFFIVATLIAKDSSLTIRNVGVNPTRTGVIEILKRMGGKIHLNNRRESAGEPVADIEVFSSKLTAIEVPQEMVSLAIDEFPVIAVAAACANGVTTVSGAKELRVKESDRITATVNGLKALGIDATERPDGMIIPGGGFDGRFTGGVVNSHDDHRIAMAFSIAAVASENRIEVMNCQNVATSFPGFSKIANSVGIRLQVA